MSYVLRLGDLILDACTCFTIPPVNVHRKGSAFGFDFSVIFLCVRMRVHMRTHTVPMERKASLFSWTWHETPSYGSSCDVPMWHPTAASTNPCSDWSTNLHRLRRELDHVLHALAVVMPGLLLVDHIPLVLGKVQEATDGTEVLPERAVFWAGVLLPAEQFTQPALEREGHVSSPSECRPAEDALAAVKCHPTFLYFLSKLFPPTWGDTETAWSLKNRPITTSVYTNAWEPSLLLPYHPSYHMHSQVIHSSFVEILEQEYSYLILRKSNLCWSTTIF